MMHTSYSLFRRQQWTEQGLAVFVRPADTIKMDTIPMIKSLPQGVKDYLEVVHKMDNIENVHFHPYLCAVLDNQIINGFRLSEDDVAAKDWYRVVVRKDIKPEDYKPYHPKFMTVITFDINQKAEILAQVMNHFVDLSYEHINVVKKLTSLIMDRYDATKGDQKFSKHLDIARAEVFSDFLNDRIDFDDLQTYKDRDWVLLTSEPSIGHSEDPVIKTKERND